MVKFALFVKERVGLKAGKFVRLTKIGKEFPSKAKAEKRKMQLIPQTRKKIGIRKVKTKFKI